MSNKVKETAEACPVGAIEITETAEVSE